MNILWITLDSLKATALPQYGNPYVNAPAAQRVADKGIVFSHAFCQMPKCVPSRPSQISGRYPHCEGLRALNGKVGEKSDKFLITRDIPNIIIFLKENGYTTCAKGPNHLVDWDVYEQWFDVPMDWDSGFRDTKHPPKQEDPLAFRMRCGNMPADFDTEATSDAETARQMIDFFGQSRDKPFFAYLDLRAPHPMYYPWPPFAEEYATMDIPVPSKFPVDKAPWTERVYRQVYDLEDAPEQRWQDLIRSYYCGISYADMLAGRVLDALAASGREGETIVIYSADHGDFAGEHGCVEKHDPFLYDCMNRVPFILQMPPGYPRGEKREVLMEMIDIVPTLMELCDFEVPGWVQGKSLLPVINSETIEHRDAVFCQGGVERQAIDRREAADSEYFESFHGNQYEWKQQAIIDYPEFMMRAKMIRTKTHKLIYRLNGHHELYDLAKDPGELHNLIEDPAYATVLTDLQERLLQWTIESETNLPLIDQVWA